MPTDKQREYARNWYRTKYGVKELTCLQCGNKFKRLGRKKGTCSDVCTIAYKVKARKQWRDSLRLETIKAYGGQCTCCGETELCFLTIDHIEARGRQHRDKVLGKRKPSSAFYQWLKTSNWPGGYQVLCYNCNCAKRTSGSCPGKHERIKHDHNFLLKIISEIGDLSRDIRDLEAHVIHLERKLCEHETNTHK
jgi:hypothetical protein